MRVLRYGILFSVIFLLTACGQHPAEKMRGDSATAPSPGKIEVIKPVVSPTPANKNDSTVVVAPGNRPDTFSYPWTGTDTTVLGFYLNLPGKFLLNSEGKLLIDSANDNRDTRMKFISAKKRTPFYLKLDGSGNHKAWEGWVDLGLFHDSVEGENFLGVFYYDCGPGCSVEFTFVKYKNKKWADITDSAFHVIPDDQLKLRYASVIHQKVQNVDAPGVLYELHPEKNIITLIADPQFEDGKRIVLYELKLKTGHFIAVK